MTTTAVVTIAHRRARHLRRQHWSLAEGTRLPDHYVVVAMDDPELEGWVTDDRPHPTVVRGPDGGSQLPLAAARNAGVDTAIRAGAEVVVVLDVDCMVGAGAVAAYEDAVAERPDVLWSGPVTYLLPEAADCSPAELAALDDPHPHRPAPPPGERWLDAEPDLFWSLSFAVHARSWSAVGGFCERYVGYGGEDTDLGWTWSSSGRSLGWVGDARAYHQHHPTQDPPVQHLDDILRNGAVFADRWGRWPMEGWLAEFERAGLVDRDGRGGWVRA